MISLRKTLKMVPELSGLIPSEIEIRERVAFILAGIRKFYVQLPLIYIQTTIVTVTLLLALGAGLATPWWGNLLFVSLH